MIEERRGSGLDPEALRELYQISQDDLNLIRDLAGAVIDGISEHVHNFYDWLRTQPEYDEYFSDDQVQKRVEGLVTNYWHQFFRAEIDDEYMSSRQRVGTTHARINLPLSTYFAAMNVFLGLFTEVVDANRSGDGPSDTLKALMKQVHMDTAVVVETYSQHVNETMAMQSRSLMEMSTPVTQIWSGILLLPIVGIVDSKRAQDIMNAALEKIAETQARVFIMDISGVAVVDTAVANHLIKITKATRLMGCSCTISGVSPAIAQTIVELGIEVGTVKTTATMKDALSDAYNRLGMEIKLVS
ncbi:MAG: STAS domain-containing protein [Anaerolineaceae bacterium]|nr:MAG: STAS domain-containing protein [Anaerolineaceae bacterium]